MKASQFLISTLKEAPTDAEVASHKLMMRAGMIKKLGAGIYTYMPMGLRVIRKVEAIVREEMNRAGAVEMTMPVVQPAELWQETGRFEKMGPELLRIKDRHGRDYVVQPTSDYAANMEKAEALAPAGPRATAANPMVKTPTPGKSTCAEVAELLGVPLATTVKSLVLATDTLNEAGEIVKSQVWLLLLRGDHDMNEVKVGKVPGLDTGFRFATIPEIEAHFGCQPGYLGPVGLKLPVKLVVDREVAVLADWICGANQPDFHMTGVNWGRDLSEPELVADLRNVVEGDASPDGQGALAIERGIEVGHVFYLGTKYSKGMGATFLGEDGKPAHFEMGCYGIGITRLPAAAIEQNHDERGIIWPDAIAPFTVVICPIGMDRSPEVKAAAEQLHEQLVAAGVDVLLDDRGERPGAMFADWELIGVPHRVTIGDRGIKEGQIEYQHRRDAAATKVAVAEVLDFLKGRIAA